jgi:hypothetical protein
MVIKSGVLHGSIGIIQLRVSHHKKSEDLVTGSFLLRVVTRLSNLSSEASGSYQSRLIGQVVFCSNNEYAFKAT